MLVWQTSPQVTTADCQIWLLGELPELVGQQQFERVHTGLELVVRPDVAGVEAYSPPEEHEPDPETREAYDDAYRRYRDVYFAMKPVFGP